MATKKQNFNCDVYAELDGVCNSDVKAKIIEELLKYILYQRQQIPVTYDTLKADSVREPTKSDGLKVKRELKQKMEIIQNMENIADTLRQAFTYGTVKEVLVILGATPVSPKEVYKVCFPVGFFEGKILSLKECSSVLFRKLVTNDFMTDLKPPKTCTKLSVFLFAPRDMKIQSKFLMPKLNFKIPANRGHRMNIYMDCLAAVTSANLTKMDETDANISGIEPLEKLSCLSLTPSLTPHRAVNSTQDYTTPCFSDKSSGSDLSVVNGAGRTRTISVNSLKDGDNNTDFIWYQITATVKGFKDKMDQKQHSESLFMV